MAPRALAYERRLIGLLDSEERRWLDRILDKLGAEPVREVLAS